MEQKTDLRIVKTEKAIREAFLDIRRKTPLERVKVSDICKRAMINPSTFYKHYADVMALSETMENDLVAKCLQDHRNIDCLFTDPYRYLISFQESLMKNEGEINIIFSGRQGVLLEKTEQIMRSNYLSGDADEEAKVKVLFAMGGIIHASTVLNRNRDYPTDKLSKQLADLIQKLA